MPLRMALVDERTEVVGRAVAARRREVPGDLIAPRPLERMLHHRQQLDVREPVLHDVRHQLVGELAPGERPKPVLGLAAPRPGVDFVDRHRAIERRPAGATRGHPRVVAPHVAAEVRRHRGGSRRTLGRSANGSALVNGGPCRGLNLELVERALADAWNERLPQAAAPTGAQRMRAAVPAVEVADDRDAARVRRPDDERIAARRRRSSAGRAPIFSQARSQWPSPKR